MSKSEKVAVVTGGLGGAGTTIAKRFAGEGYIVALLDLPSHRGEAFAKELSSNFEAIYIPIDAVQFEQVEKAMEKIIDKYGRIDTLVNCIGRNGKSSIEDVTEDEIDRVLSVNVKGTMFCCRAVIPYMKKAGKGTIVNIGATCSKMATGRELVYAASKAAVAAFTREMAADLWRYDIRCNTLSPSTFVSPSNKDLFNDRAWVEDQKDRVLADRLMEPKDVAEVACFLASDDSFCLNGSEIFLDGAGMYYRDRPTESGFNATS